jgi:hypothetical protein
MAIGKRKTDGDRLGKWSWDFSLGKSVLEDRVRTDNGWESQQRNIENKEFRAVIDLPNLERGWVAYVKGEGLNAELAKIGKDYGDPPSDKHKEGLRLVAKMDAALLGGGVRELISTSSGLWTAVDKLHDDYIAGVAKHDGCLPAVDIVEVREEPGKSGSIFIPVFKISGWVPRPPELPATGIPLFKRVKKANAGSSAEPASDNFERPKPKDDFNDAVPF